MSKFINKATRAVSMSEGTIAEEDLYVVWFCKTLGNWKALVSTDKVNGRYWEVTHNGAKMETYVDRYEKAANVAISDEMLEAL